MTTPDVIHVEPVIPDIEPGRGHVPRRDCPCGVVVVGLDMASGALVVRHRTPSRTAQRERITPTLPSWR